uniref:Uncharacterized protein n=1 Tax=Chaetoceros debilis TaxID=122233 RepID=A0A7S3QBA4_9STRA|mmetsp:Transcript_22841/g.33822  ORF Transcript_22841/g.33822 Transcript_22841/m.33822 type:complete len:136 (-) Transcript_22841:164-571(-)
MFSRASSIARSSGRSLLRQASRPKNQQRRNMGGGSHWMEVSEVHTNLGEAFGFVCWMWIFYRARNDLPVVLGWRHPWEHAEDPWAGVEPKDDELEDIEGLRAEWDSFQVKAENPEEDDDDDDDDDDEEDDDDDEE